MRMKSNIASYMAVMLMIVSLFAVSACGQDTGAHSGDISRAVEQLESEKADLKTTIALLEATVESYREVSLAGEVQVQISLAECGGDCVLLELPEQWAQISGVQRFTQANVIFEADHDARGKIRVFERGNANIRLFPDGTFIANLWHNTKISGTYRELVQGSETAVLFTHSGITNLSGGASSFEETGLVTVVGGITDDIMTMPEDWDDGHGHGMEFAFITHPLVFVCENNQRVTLNADNTFVANFDGDVTIIGFYGKRSTSITFVPGSPAFTLAGLPIGSFLPAQLVSCRDEYSPPQGQNHVHSHIYYDCDDCDAVQEQFPIPEPKPAQQPRQYDYDDDDEHSSVSQDPEWCDECGEYH